MPTKSKHSFKAVLVKWRDPEVKGGWHMKAEIDSVMAPIYSIGYLVREDKDTLVVAGTLAPDWDHKGDDMVFADVMKFPMGCVLEIIEIDMEV